MKTKEWIELQKEAGLLAMDNQSLIECIEAFTDEIKDEGREVKNIYREYEAFDNKLEERILDAFRTYEHKNKVWLNEDEEAEFCGGFIERIENRINWELELD